MITQQLTANTNNMSGRLEITAAAGQLAELQSLAQELKLRPNVTTNGTVEILVQLPPPNDV